MSDLSGPAAEPVLANVQREAFRSLPRLANRTNLFIDPIVFAADHILTLADQVIRVERPSVLVFADDLPGANWAHPCRYLFHDATDGRLVQAVAAGFPPEFADPTRERRAFHTPVQLARRDVPVLQEQIDWSVILGVGPFVARRQEQRYAVLFTGTSSNNRHVNDLELLYRTLVDLYGFSPANVFVLCFDGTIKWLGAPQPPGDWPGDSTAHHMGIDAAATKADLTTVFNTLKGLLMPDDLLVIHTNNHGFHDGTQSQLCVGPGVNLSAAEFGDLLAGLPVYDSLMVMMEQCNSGGFNPTVIQKSTATNTCIASAADASHSSWGGAHFDSFAEVWIEAMRGATAFGAALPADPDVDDDGRVSAREAFDYAVVHTDFRDTPMLDEKPAGCASHMFLGVPQSDDLAARIRDLLGRIAVVEKPIPIPDPGPLRHIEVPVAIPDLAGRRSVELHDLQLAKVAKAMGRRGMTPG